MLEPAGNAHRHKGLHLNLVYGKEQTYSLSVATFTPSVAYVDFRDKRHAFAKEETGNSRLFPA